MALTKCRECGRQISSLAKACPGCGAAPPKRSTVSTGCGCLLFGIILLLALPYLVPSSLSIQTTVESPQAAPQPLPQTPDQPNVIANSEATQPAEQTSNRTASVLPNPAVQESKDKYIPGFKAADVYEPLQEQGFQFSQRVDPKITEQSIWTCKKKTSSDEKIVEIFGDSPTNITLVRITYHNTSARDTNYGCKQFMADAATLSYTGSQPDSAKTWVEESVGKNAVKTIAGMSFRLTASDSQSRRLIITPASTVTSNAPDISSTRKPRAKTSRESTNLDVSSLIVKKIDGTHRYFFQIANNADHAFDGEIEIVLLNKQKGIKNATETFSTTSPMQPQGGTFVYLDAKTGPVHVHGDWGVAEFSYTAKSKGKVVDTGRGRISNKYEDLSQ